MRKTWRGVECLPPQDDELKLVISMSNISTIARYIDDLWIDEYTNRLIKVQFWMPIPIPPNE